MTVVHTWLWCTGICFGADLVVVMGSERATWLTIVTGLSCIFYHQMLLKKSPLFFRILLFKNLGLYVQKHMPAKIKTLMCIDIGKQHAHWPTSSLLSFKSVTLLLTKHLISDTTLLQIPGWYSSQRVRGEEEGREGHGGGRRGQAGWHGDDGRSVRERAVTTGSPHVYRTGASRGVEKHGRRVHGVCGQICGHIYVFKDPNLKFVDFPLTFFFMY